MNTVPFEVIPLTETSYAVFREDLERIIAHPETAFFMVGDAEETIIRSVLGAMSQGAMHSASGSTDCRSTNSTSCTAPSATLPMGCPYPEA